MCIVNTFLCFLIINRMVRVMSGYKKTNFKLVFAFKLSLLFAISPSLFLYNIMLNSLLLLGMSLALCVIQMNYINFCELPAQFQQQQKQMTKKRVFFLLYLFILHAYTQYYIRVLFLLMNCYRYNERQRFFWELIIESSIVYWWKNVFNPTFCIIFFVSIL